MFYLSSPVTNLYFPASSSSDLIYTILASA